ncbi:MAG: hypothetical protein LC713_04960, partial [Actinobacteria bacterium]|nr:hypothetical protein [Actinomycetota bacterium]
MPALKGRADLAARPLNPRPPEGAGASYPLGGTPGSLAMPALKGRADLAARPLNPRPPEGAGASYPLGGTP